MRITIYKRYNEYISHDFPPQELDIIKDFLYNEKAKAARTFKRWRDVVTHDPKYISMRKMWREYENHNLQEIQ